ncbi:MAG: hypothetical protein FWG85_04185 [Bacteroidetes bacterium]|nr:hypothetical protein [Bacteroidota bacterium]
MIKNNFIKMLFFAIAILFFGCVKEPNNPNGNENNDGYNCCFILNEGLRGTDNASITKYNLDNNNYTNYYFKKSNINLKIGDNANDIVLFDSLAFVSVSGAGTIEVFNIYDGKSQGRITFPLRTMPRKMIIINDTLAFVTAYIELSNSDYYVYYFNPSNLTTQQNIENNKIQVGSHPEGICYDSVNQRLYVVNSGYGDLDYDNSVASTISIIDIKTKTEISKINTHPNPMRIYFKNNKIYVICWGLPSDTNEIKGSLIEYEPNDMQIVRQWNTNIYDLCFNETSDTLYFINSTWGIINTDASIPGIYYINLYDSNSVPQLMITNSQKYDIWTSLAINFVDKSIWIANSFNFNTDGEIIIYDNMQFRTKFNVGTIPNVIRFNTQ